MDDLRWTELVRDIKGDNIERMVEASECLLNEAEESDVPRLLALLKSEDSVVRESAAWALALVGGPTVLLDLFDAYQRGLDEGFDNDGFTAALIELVSRKKADSRERLLQLCESPTPYIQKYAKWLLEFC